MERKNESSTRKQSDVPLYQASEAKPATEDDSSADNREKVIIPMHRKVHSSQAVAVAVATPNTQKELLRAEKKRKNNAIQSARKRERQKTTIEKLRSQCSEFHEKNLDVYRKNQLLEDLVKRATELTDTNINEQPEQPVQKALVSFQEEELNSNVGVKIAPLIHPKVPRPGAQQDGSLSLEQFAFPITNLQAPPLSFNSVGYGFDRASHNHSNVISSIPNVQVPFPTLANSAAYPAESTKEQPTSKSSNVSQYSVSTSDVLMNESLVVPMELLSRTLQETIVPGLIDREALYQNLLPTLLLMEAGVDPIPILQQKIAQHIFRIQGLMQQEELIKTGPTLDKVHLVTGSCLSNIVGNPTLTSLVPNERSTTTLTNSSFGIEQIPKELAQNLLLKWLESKPIANTSEEISDDKNQKPEAKR
jgi:hypothetical protein